MALPDGRPSLHDLNPARYSNSRAAGMATQHAIDLQRASPEYRAREANMRSSLGLPAKGSHAATAHAGVKGHANDVKGGGGGHGGNPNHDEHGRFA
jgi:hypothetical protein